MSPTPRPQNGLHFLVVGSSISALAAAYCLGKSGHHISIIDPMNGRGDTHPYIRLAPNAVRLLSRWGLAAKLKEFAITPQQHTFRQYGDGSLLGRTELGRSIEEAYGATYYYITHENLYGILRDLASPYVSSWHSSPIVSIDVHLPCVILSGGQSLAADAIIAADGLDSVTRGRISLGREQLWQSPTTRLRGVVPNDAKNDDYLGLGRILGQRGMSTWLGPQVQVSVCALPSGNDVELVAPRTSLGRSSQKMKLPSGSEPQLQKLLNMTVWSSSSPQPDVISLESWVHPDGKVALLGESAHPMLSHCCQNTAMNLEDAAVLGNLFSRAQTSSQIPFLLHAFQSIRIPRVTEVQTSNPELGMSLTTAENNRVFRYDADVAVEGWWLKRHGLKARRDIPVEDHTSQHMAHL
ncbi:hypothetical protein DL96DRAFT_1553213 [Flagelloscypha sp. PMI_526]|nr:hypothetical protein DL96DRAFT_1553213 [Flagelloscypha sp. PMI_526]